MTAKRSQPSLQAAKTCELHVHIGGSLFAADLLDLARDYYEKIDWSLFVDSFERTYGDVPTRLRCSARHFTANVSTRSRRTTCTARKAGATLPISKPSST